MPALSTRTWLRLLAAALWLASALPAQAQEELPLSPGTDVRMSTTLGYVRGMVLAVHPDSLLVHPTEGSWVDSLVVLRSSIRSLHVSLGPKPPLDAALKGAAIGLAAAGAGGALVLLAGGYSDGWGLMGAYSVATALALPLSAAGALIGALSPGHRWQAVPVPSRFTPAPEAKPHAPLELEERAR